MGLPLCIGIPKKCSWDPVIERIEHRLSNWKGKFLSLGGPITLLELVLISIPIYFLSWFNMIFYGTKPVNIGKYHLVNWNQVCKPIYCRGLGIRQIRALNRGMLGKWLWRVGDKNHGLWRRLLIDKYKLFNQGWIIPSVSYRRVWYVETHFECEI